MITIKEIASQLGMSTTTVSNVIHGKTREVSPATIVPAAFSLEASVYPFGILVSVTVYAASGGTAVDSARQVGMMLGGENFQSVSYSGENRSIYISPVDESLLLVQVFPGSRLPNRIDDFNRLLVEKLVDAVPAFTQNTSKLR